MGLPADDYMLDLTGNGFISSEVSGTNEEERFYWYVIHRVPEMPSIWHENKRGGESVRYEIHQEVTLDADCTIDTYYNDIGTLETNSVDGAQTAYWHSVENDGYIEPTKFTRYPSLSTSDKPGFTISEISYEFDADSTGDTMIIYNEFFRAIHDESYDGEAVEIIERDGTGQLYERKMSVSSWLVMRVLIDTLNKIMYESTPAFNVPVFGIYDQSHH